MPLLGKGFGSGSTELKPMPVFGRMMAFIDGENIVMRYKDMIKKGLNPRKQIDYEEDIFVWQSNTIQPGLNEVIRAIYYTSTGGDKEKVDSITEKIKNLTFNKHPDSQIENNLYPKVFWKPNKQKKSKGVDIQMTVDILSNVYLNNLDIVFLVSGDGDYKPIIDEVIRYGKRIYLAAFSSGLNETIKHTADKFVDLDKIYFQ